MNLSNYIKIDTHCHTYPTSVCSKLSPEQLVNAYVEMGFGAIMLTNHYKKGHIDRIYNDKKSIIEFYLDDYQKVTNAAKHTGLKVFLGAEVQFVSEEFYVDEDGVKYPANGEMLLFGVSEDFLFKTYNLSDLTQKELFDVCTRNNILMFQSHPYRSEHHCIPLNPKYMHGVEVFNPHFISRVESCLDFAKSNDLLMCAGSDAHGDVEFGNGGMYIPKDISNQFELRDYLKTGENLIFDTKGIFIINGNMIRNTAL